MDVLAIKNSDDPKGEGLAQKAAEYNCEAVITGTLTPEAFDIIADRNITRYDGHGYSVIDALALMDQNRLKLIRNVKGTDECESEHTDSSYDSHHK
jgi:predicted Fe-Mo cluster-binding NifX family protein